MDKRSPQSTSPNSIEHFDLIVIGGGCNGTGIARDAAMRGIRTLLLEKYDFGGGTTGRSSRMIHGGIRYLLHDPHTTYLSCLDSGYIQQIAPHLLVRIPFLALYFGTKSRNPFKKVWKDKIYPILMEAFFKGYDRYQPLKNGKPSTHLNAKECFALEPGLNPEVLGAMTMDEWWIDVFRLCLLNALSAQEHGAVIRTGLEVVGLLRNKTGRVFGVKTRDVETGERKEYQASWVFNAGGPWGAKVANLADAQVKIRPGKGTHIEFDRRISNYAISCDAIDGRQIFLMPNDNTTIIGTTDDDYYGDLDNVLPTRDEIEYLLEGIERIFPSIRQARMIRAFSGLRPSLYEWGRYESDISRAHKIYDHSEEGAPGFLSIAGGKLASYRIMAEEATDQIAQRLGNTTSCATHRTPLPGGEHTPDAHELAKRYELPLFPVQRLILRHGSHSETILQQGKANQTLDVVCSCEPVLQCELDYVLEHELVRRPSDLSRRTRLGQGPCLGTRCALSASRIFCRHHPKTTVEEAFWELRQTLWREQAPVMFGASLRQAAFQHELQQQIARPPSSNPTKS